MKHIMKKIRIILAMVLALSFIMPNILPEINYVKKVEASTIKLNKDKATLISGDTLNLKISGTKKLVTWKSSNTKIASINMKGKLTAVNAGTATITAALNGSKYTCRITVESPKLSKTEVITRIGWKEQLKVSDTTQTVTWSTSDNSIASVSEKGLVTGWNIGEAIITATVGTHDYTCTIKIPKPHFISSSLEINVGETASNTLLYSSDNSLWYSSDESIATVDKYGKVTGVNAGSTNINITTGGYTYSYIVLVKKTSYSVGESWTVDGQWKFTVNSVTTTSKRNMFADVNPVQVIIINYTYENIGYKGKLQDLYISSLAFDLMDEGKEMCDLYPASTKDPKTTPIGAKCVGAEEAYGLNNYSKTVTLYVELYDSNSVRQKATFVLKVD